MNLIKTKYIFLIIITLFSMASIAMDDCDEHGIESNGMLFRCKLENKKIIKPDGTNFDLNGFWVRQSSLINVTFINIYTEPTALQAIRFDGSTINNLSLFVAHGKRIGNLFFSNGFTHNSDDIKLFSEIDPDKRDTIGIGALVLNGFLTSKAGVVHFNSIDIAAQVNRLIIRNLNSQYLYIQTVPVIIDIFDNENPSLPRTRIDILDLHDINTSLKGNSPDQVINLAILLNAYIILLPKKFDFSHVALKELQFIADGKHHVVAEDAIMPDIMEDLNMEGWVINMANFEHVHSIKSTNLNKLDLRHVNMSANQYRHSALEIIGGSMNDTRLDNANLEGINFYGVSMRHAKLDNAKLNGIKMYEVDEYGASGSGIELTDPEFYRANLQHTNLRGQVVAAQFNETNAQNANITATNNENATATILRSNFTQATFTGFRRISTARTILDDMIIHDH